MGWSGQFSLFRVVWVPCSGMNRVCKCSEKTTSVVCRLFVFHLASGSVENQGSWWDMILNDAPGVSADDGFCSTVALIAWHICSINATFLLIFVWTVVTDVSSSSCTTYSSSFHEQNRHHGQLRLTSLTDKLCYCCCASSTLLLRTFWQDAVSFLLLEAEQLTQAWLVCQVNFDFHETWRRFSEKWKRHEEEYANAVKLWNVFYNRLPGSISKRYPLSFAR